MSLPSAFLDELRSRLSLADVVGRKVMWDSRKSNRGRGDWWAPCPFHQEKTASFHVDERKGFYYCFGCHAKGDAISFVRETENVGFMEAVEILAAEAGMEMPARDPQAAEKADRRQRLTEVVEAAARFYRRMLATGHGAGARAYLARRGLAEDALERFGIGYAPAGRRATFEALTGAGLPADLVVEAGIAARPEGGGDPYDRMQDRVIFPIRDARGRAIGFGGRAMAEGAKAKYLNSPETPLFDKGASLYNHDRARAAAGRGAPLIVAEGYMDVVALVEGGFAAAVAPLGTAITERQLEQIWRIHPEPVIALDGDAAGLRAAYRAMDLALPLIGAGRALRFCLMPPGKDPDDLIREAGPEAMQAALDASLPLVRLLWRRETEGRVLDSPERRAALDASLRKAVGRIADADLRAHYAAEIRGLRADLFGTAPRAPAPRGGARPARAWQRRGAAWAPPPQPCAATRNSDLIRGGEDVGDRLREATILAVLIRYPALLEEFGHALEELTFAGPGHAEIAAALLACDPAATSAEIESDLVARLGPGTLESLFAPVHLRLVPPLRAPGRDDAARLCLAEELAKLGAHRGAADEVAEALADIAGETGETDLTWRLRDAAHARSEAVRSREGDDVDYDIAENGARIDRAQRRRFQALARSLGFAPSGNDED